jgi:hypothetical protein
MRAMARYDSWHYSLVRMGRCTVEDDGRNVVSHGAQDELFRAEAEFWRELTKILKELFRSKSFATSIGQNQIGGNMATNFSVQAGGPPAVVQFIPQPSGSVFFSPASFAPVPDDPAVQISPNPGDTTGTEFAILVPASDTNASFNLAVSGPDGAGGAVINGTQLWTIIPAVVVPPPATSIGQQQLS